MQLSHNNINNNNNNNNKSKVNNNFELSPRSLLNQPVAKFNRALIVDDSKMNRKFNRRLLERYFDYIEEVMLLRAQNYLEDNFHVRKN